MLAAQPQRELGRKRERSGKRILTKRTTLTKEIIQRLSAKDLARVRIVGHTDYDLLAEPD